MKILLLFMVLAIAISVRAQEKGLPQIKPGTEFKDDTMAEIPMYGSLPDSLALSHSSRHQLEFPMPVAKFDSGPSYFNMPIKVPDSTVHYFILQKRIDMVNPLEQPGH